MNNSEQKKYSRAEVQEKTLEYFEGDNLATDVWINKYALKDHEGNIYELTPDDMHHRLASEFARIESTYLSDDPLSEDTIYDLLKDFKYIIPQGSPMSGIGNDFQTVSLGNCFVLKNEYDSYGGILKLDQELVHLMKRRAGVGIDLSFLRPKGSRVNNAAVTSTGVVPFMERYSNSTREVAQGGRRGALLLSISCKHPDAEEFIDAKLELKKVTGANVSVKISDEFMNCVINDTPFIQQFPIDSDTPEFKQEISAKKLWKKLIHNSWKSAEPGMFFWDQVIRESPSDCYTDQGFGSITTNPCGEIPLNQDSCRLLCINLYSYVKNPFTPEASFNFGLFENHAYYAQRLMDDIVDLEDEKIQKIIQKVHLDPESQEVKQIELDLWRGMQENLEKGRRTGLGITAEGDMLAALGLKYGSPEATEMSEKVHQTLAVGSFISSVNMAKTRGSFRIWNFEKEKDNPFIQRVLAKIEEWYEDDAIPVLEDYKNFGRRNISETTISPTGSLSLLSKTSSGVEPVFMLYHTRRRKINPNDKSTKVDFIDDLGDHWEEYNVVHPKFQVWAQINGHGDLKKYNKHQIEELIKQSPYYKATANEIDWLEKINMIGKIQKWISHSISNTLNLPEHVSEEVVSEVFMTGWKAGCKGLTIYRDKSRSGVLVDLPENKINVFKENHAPKRPKVLNCDVIRFVNKGEKWIGFLGLYNARPYELFTGPADQVPIPIYINSAEIVKDKHENGSNLYNLRYTDKDGFIQEFHGLSRAFNREYWNTGKMISAILRHGMPIQNVLYLIDTLDIEGKELLTNWANGVKRMLKKYISDGTKTKDLCPECSNQLIFISGCNQCQNCGYSKCS